jgi:hypothetical protein
MTKPLVPYLEEKLEILAAAQIALQILDLIFRGCQHRAGSFRPPKAPTTRFAKYKIADAGSMITTRTLAAVLCNDRKTDRSDFLESRASTGIRIAAFTNGSGDRAKYLKSLFKIQM